MTSLDRPGKAEDCNDESRGQQRSRSEHWQVEIQLIPEQSFRQRWFPTLSDAVEASQWGSGQPSSILWRRYIRTGLTIGTIGLLAWTGYTLFDKPQKDPFTIHGELIDAYKQETNMGDLYRIVVDTDKGRVTYPIIASPDEMKVLDEMFTTSTESGAKGDRIAVNPTSYIFSLDEVILTPENIKKGYDNNEDN